MFQKVQRESQFYLFLRFGPRHSIIDDKWHLATPLSSSGQYQCVCKILSKYSNGFRDRAGFTFFSEFEPRQRLGQSQMTFDNLLSYILPISMCIRGETIHRNYGASRFSGHDSVHDFFSPSVDTVQFTQV